MILDEKHHVCHGKPRDRTLYGVVSSQAHCTTFPSQLHIAMCWPGPASHDIFVMELEHFSCPHSHRPGADLWSRWSALSFGQHCQNKIAFEEEWLLRKKVKYRCSACFDTSFWILERAEDLDLDPVQFYSWLLHLLTLYIRVCFKKFQNLSFFSAKWERSFWPQKAPVNRKWEAEWNYRLTFWLLVGLH